MKVNMKEIREEIKKLVISKGLDNILNADLNEIHNRTGASRPRSTGAKKEGKQNETPGNAGEIS